MTPHTHTSFMAFFLPVKASNRHVLVEQDFVPQRQPSAIDESKTLSAKKRLKNAIIWREKEIANALLTL